MKKFILIIVAAFLFTSCGMSLAVYDEYYERHPYLYHYYYARRPHKPYPYHYAPRHCEPAPPVNPNPSPDVRPAQPAHVRHGNTNHKPKPNGNGRIIRSNYNSGGGPARRK